MNQFGDRDDLDRFERLLETADPDGKLLYAWKLEGGVSAQVTGLEVAQPGGWSSKLVVRCYGDADTARNPNVAADEFNLLLVLSSADFTVPGPLAFDQSNEIFPGPLIVVEYIEGEQEFNPSNLSDHLAQVAANLAQIHAVDHIGYGLAFLPTEPDPIDALNTHRQSAAIDPAIQERIMRAVSDVGPRSFTNRHALLHGDYWSGNLLWRNGKLVGIIDWEDEAIGDPLADLAKCRLEFLCAFGWPAVTELTDRYCVLAPAVELNDLPIWDLSMAAKMASKFPNWGLDEKAEKAMRVNVNYFIGQALETWSG